MSSTPTEQKLQENSREWRSEPEMIAYFTNKGTRAPECDIFQEIFKDNFEKMFVKKLSDKSKEHVNSPAFRYLCPSNPGSSFSFEVITISEIKSIQYVSKVEGDCRILRCARLWVFHCRFRLNEQRMKGHSVFVVAIDHDDKRYVWNTKHNCYNSRHCNPVKVILPNFCVLCGRPFMTPKSYRGKRPQCTGCRAYPLLIDHFPHALCGIVQAYV